MKLLAALLGNLPTALAGHLPAALLGLLPTFLRGHLFLGGVLQGTTSIAAVVLSGVMLLNSFMACRALGLVCSAALLLVFRVAFLFILSAALLLIYSVTGLLIISPALLSILRAALLLIVGTALPAVFSDRSTLLLV